MALVTQGVQLSQKFQIDCFIFPKWPFFQLNFGGKKHELMVVLLMTSLQIDLLDYRLLS